MVWCRQKKKPWWCRASTSYSSHLGARASLRQVSHLSFEERCYSAASLEVLAESAAAYNLRSIFKRGAWLVPVLVVGTEGF
jgi:hypothetical protein